MSIIVQRNMYKQIWKTECFDFYLFLADITFVCILDKSSTISNSAQLSSFSLYFPSVLLMIGASGSFYQSAISLPL